MHLVIDNYATHKAPTVRNRLNRGRGIVLTRFLAENDAVLSGGLEHKVTVGADTVLNAESALAPRQKIRGPESAALHQMCVALRRLRAAISLLSEVVSDDRVDTIKTELSGSHGKS